jgi:hypothetical protein
MRLTNIALARSTISGQERRHRAQESKPYAFDRGGLVGVGWLGLVAMC